MPIAALYHAVPPPQVPARRTIGRPATRRSVRCASGTAFLSETKRPEKLRIMSMWRPPAKADDAPV